MVARGCLIALCAALVWGCSSTPEYLAARRVEPLLREVPRGSERTILLPSQIDPRTERIQVTRWFFEFDLSVLPPRARILEAVFEAYALEKKVWAKSLGGKAAADLAPYLIPTSYYGSVMRRPESQSMGASESTSTWKVGGFWDGIVMRTGGVGGHGAYVTELPGWDRWNVTEACRAWFSGAKTFSFYLGYTHAEAASFMTPPTIFTTTVLPETFVYAGPGRKETAPRLVVTYEER